MQAMPVCSHPTLEQVFESDRLARAKARELLEESRYAL